MCRRFSAHYRNPVLRALFTRSPKIGARGAETHGCCRNPLKMPVLRPTYRYACRLRIHSSVLSCVAWSRSCSASAQAHRHRPQRRLAPRASHDRQRKPGNYHAQHAAATGPTTDKNRAQPTSSLDSYTDGNPAAQAPDHRRQRGCLTSAAQGLQPHRGQPRGMLTWRQRSAIRTSALAPNPPVTPQTLSGRAYGAISSAWE